MSDYDFERLSTRMAQKRADRLECLKAAGRRMSAREAAAILPDDYDGWEAEAPCTARPRVRLIDDPRR